MALVLTDQSGNGNTLTNSSATEYTSTHPFAGSNEAVGLVGASSQSLNATTSASLSPTSAITVRCWLKSTEAGTKMIAQNAEFGASYSGWWLQVSGGKARFGINKDSGTTQGVDYQFAETSTSVNSGNWVHICGTWDGSNIKIYLDGNTTADVTTAWSGGLAYSATTYVRVGCENDSGSDISFLTATGLTEIRVHNTALTGAQNAADYNTQLTSPTSSDLKAYWPFETIASSATSGNGYFYVSL